MRFFKKRLGQYVTLGDDDWTPFDELETTEQVFLPGDDLGRAPRPPVGGRLRVLTCRNYTNYTSVEALMAACSVLVPGSLA